MFKKINQHLKAASKTYFELQKFAIRASLIYLKSSFAAFVPGICPELFGYDASVNIKKKLHEDMEPVYKIREDKNI